MSFVKDTMDSRQLLAVLLLFFWLFGQLSLSAHEILVEHDIEVHCDWLCQTSNKDDVTTDKSNKSTGDSVAFVFTRANVSIIFVKHPYIQPFHRGPPHNFSY